MTVKDEIKTGYVRTRQVEWVDGTQYVWISGPREMQDNVFIIDLLTREHVKTMSINDPKKFVSVVNYDIPGLTEMIERSVMPPPDVEFSMFPTESWPIECIDDKKKKFNYRRTTYKSNGAIKQYSNWEKRKNKNVPFLQKKMILQLK